MHQKGLWQIDLHRAILPVIGTAKVGKRQRIGDSYSLPSMDGIDVHPEANQNGV